MTAENDLLINDVFWTVQGEGANSGRRALFVRMPFCNLACTWCDTEFNSYKKWSERELVAYANQEACRFAVLTGGEPMLNKHSPRVITVLKNHGFEIATETNGTVPILKDLDFVTVSPKRFSTDRNLPPYYVCAHARQTAHEFKFVVDDQFDFDVLKDYNPHDGRRYSLSPEFGGLQKNIERILQYVKNNPAWRISLQTHKWMGVK